MEYLEQVLPMIRASLLPGGGLLLLGALLGAGLVQLRRSGRTLPAWLPWLVAAAALVEGYRRVFGRLSLFDDAYISFRYSRNFAEGHGLVWNLGERVEGYTNFLWTLIVGLGMKLSPLDAPALGLGLSVAVFGASLVVALLLSRRLAGGRAFLPLAVPLLALQPVFVAYGSTGMETGFCALLVLLGLAGLLEADRPLPAALAGLALIAATLTRLDHGIFYAVGSGVIALEQLRAWRAGRSRAEVLRVFVAWSLPFLLFVGWMLWKHGYYGEWLPNTYWAKSADQAWWSQGLVYSLLFWVGSLAVLPMLITLDLLRAPANVRERRLALFAVGSVLLFTTYVAKVGGDFMHGRFFVSLLPLVLLGAERVVARALDGERLLPAALLTGVLLVSVTPVQLFEGRAPIAGIVDESAYWPVVELRPEVRVDSVHWKLGHFLRDEVVARDLSPVIGSGGIGMVGYYSGLELVDSRGLTDARIARQPLAKRTRPGHEKKAPRGYLLERGVNLLRLKGGQRKFHPKRFRRLARFSMRGAGIRDEWQIATYDRELMEALAGIEGVRFTDFEDWLDDYVARLEEKRPGQVRKDLEWMRDYWFDGNSDPERLAAIEARAAQ